MEHDRIVDAQALATVEGGKLVADDGDLDAAFEDFRAALTKAQKVGNIIHMRAAVEAYDRFYEVLTRG
jgi:hypothetical protein